MQRLLSADWVTLKKLVSLDIVKIFVYLKLYDIFLGKKIVFLPVAWFLLPRKSVEVYLEVMKCLKELGIPAPQTFLCDYELVVNILY